MTRRLGDQCEQHQLQVLAGELAASREAVIVAEPMIAATAPKVTAAAPAVTLAMAPDRVPEFVKERGFSVAT
jgi:hypothetical protein